MGPTPKCKMTQPFTNKEYSYKLILKYTLIKLNMEVATKTQFTHSKLKSHLIRLLQPIQHDRPDDQPSRADAESCSDGGLHGHERRRVVGNQHDGCYRGHEERQRDGGKHRGGEAGGPLEQAEEAELLGLGEEAELLDGGEGKPEFLGLGEEPGLLDIAEDLLLLELLKDVDFDLFAAFEEDAGSEPLLLPAVVVFVHLQMEMEKEKRNGGVEID